MTYPNKLRAVDLYSGVGGWSLGLKMAGIEVVQSFELSQNANRTNALNNGHETTQTNIREINFSNLPSNIDIVVGSPPCTQFSYSNRGGNGNIKDGIKDVIKFLSIVRYIKPKFWAMENVPRFQNIIENELSKNGMLSDFMEMNINSYIFNMESFGLPQRRKRCIVGNFNFDLLKTYENNFLVSLGDVVSALSADIVYDPLYDIRTSKDKLTLHCKEPFLDAEEVRINSARKMHHVIYNSMAFPDSLCRTARTVTATCTRVGRESIVIADPDNPTEFRRLTLRERASLQGFPITFQFLGTSFAQNLKMIGNALPPPIAFYIGCAMREQNINLLPCLREAGKVFKKPNCVADNTPPESPKRRYPPTRNFRFAIPSLHLKSGVRFELRNHTEKSSVNWRIEFVYGNPKDIKSVQLGDSILNWFSGNSKAYSNPEIRKNLEKIRARLSGLDLKNMQNVWSHSGPGLTRPFMFLDILDEMATEFKSLIEKYACATSEIEDFLLSTCFEGQKNLVGNAKLLRNSNTVLSGILLGTIANQVIAKSVGIRKLETKNTEQIIPLKVV